MKKILVSACLAGKCCRYDGTAKPDEQVIRMVQEKRAVCACPETMAGLRIPRPPAEIRGGDGDDVLQKRACVYNKEGKNITKEFLDGAEKFLDFTLRGGFEEVWLKAKSPSCGVTTIYDGSFSGRLRDGCGVTCAMLRKNGVRVVEVP